MSFDDYDSFAAPDLAFPIGGKLYTVPPLTFDAGARLTRIVAGRDEEMAAAEAHELWQFVLGTAYDEMLADGVPFAATARAGQAALTDFVWGRDVAEEAWKTGRDPKAIQDALDQALAPATASAANLEESTPSPSTGTENATL